MPPFVRRARASIADALRAGLWPLPVLFVVVSVVIGIALPRLDRRVDGSLPAWLTDALFTGDADAARSVLSSIATALMTVTSLTFSLTVVTLQLASSQFSPRLLRTFVRDLFVQATLALFLSTFVFSLTVLRAVQTGDAVPQMAITLAFLLAVASVLGLVLFLAHLARQIRVETMLRTVHADAVDTLDATVGRSEREETRPSLPAVPPDAGRLLAPRSGFLLSVERERLRDAAAEAGLTVLLEVYPGSSMVAGVPVGRVWPEPPDRFLECVRDALHVGHERTAAQDITFGLRQLTDVCAKALSPGINDPTTATVALGHISALLADVGERDLRPAVLCAEDGRPVAQFDEPRFAHILDAALTQPRRYGDADPLVLSRLCQLLVELAWRLPHRLDDLRAQRDLLGQTIDGADLLPAERDRLLIELAAFDDVRS